MWVIQKIDGDEDGLDSWGVAEMEDGKVHLVYWCNEEAQALECQLAMASYDAMNAGAIPEMPERLVIWTPKPKPRPRAPRGRP